MTKRGSEPQPHLHRLQGPGQSEDRARETWTEGARESTVVKPQETISGDICRESAFLLLADSHSVGSDDHTQEEEAAGGRELREQLEYNWLWTQTVLGTNSGSAACSLCDLGQVTSPLWALVSFSVQRGMIRATHRIL